MSPISQETPLNITIVGAGIGGLATAPGLCQSGHKIRVFEKSAFANETGAAITLAANVYSIVKQLGVNVEDHGANTEDARSFYTKDGNLMYENDFTGSPGLPRLVHRVDLHEALKEKAIAEGVEINLASPVTAVGTEKASITLSNGETIVADVVLGADGIHSAVRPFVIPSSPSPSPFHVSMFRMLIPCSTLAALPLTTRFIKPLGKMTIFTDDDGRRTVSYPCRANTVMNVSVLFPTLFARTYANSGDMKTHMLEIFDDFHDSPKSLLKAAEDVSLWPLFDLAPLHTWASGSAALLGDAAHPTLPYAAQGAAQALEDAATLAVLLGPGTLAAEVPKRLQLYVDIRLDRANWVQEFARAADQSSPTRRGVPPNMNPVEFYEKVHDHDAWGYAEKKMKAASIVVE